MIIYKVTNKTTGMAYIGQTIRPFLTRKAEHLRAAANVADVKVALLIHAAIHEHGSGEFEWEVLETCSSLAHLNERERFYIKLLNTQHPNGYNSTIGGHMDENMSEGVRRKISDSMVAQHKDPSYQARVYPKLKGLTPPNKGVPMSDEQKVKVGKARKAVYDDPAYVNPNTGRKRPKEVVEKMLANRVMPTGEAWAKAHGEQYTPEVREKMRQAKLGKKPANTKKVFCNETQQVFEGLADAAKALGLPKQSIYLQIKGKLKKVGGKYTFRYLDASSQDTPK